MNADTGAATGHIDGDAHHLPVRVYFEDTDFSGVVYHGAFVHFFERGRTEALRAVGIHHTELLALSQPVVFTITKLAISYRAPARIDEVLTVKTRFAGLSGARLDVVQEIWRGERCLAEAAVTAACMSLEGRPRRLPAEIRAALAAYGCR